MDHYSKTSLKEILIRLSQEPPSEVNFIPFERLGILVSNLDSESLDIDNKDGSSLFVCSVCKKKENSSHMLELHVVETHDTYFEVQREKKPMYACFLQECKLLFMNPEERRDHCIKFHKFPHNFRFDNTKSVRKNSPSNELMELSENSGDPSPPSSSTKSPKEAAPQRVTTIQFGHKNSKCFKPEYRRPDALESMIVDMKENLPDA